MNEENGQITEHEPNAKNSMTDEISGIIAKNIWKASLAILLVLLILSVSLIWKLGDKIDQIQQQMNQLQQEVINQVSSYSSQAGAISYNVDESLQKAASIVADYSYQIQSEKIDRKRKTAPIHLMVRPKEDMANLSATFIVETKDGKTITVDGLKGEANTYTATVLLPLVDYFKLSVTFDDGTVQKSEKLEEVYQPFDQYLMKTDSVVSFSSSMNYDKEKHKIAYHGTVDTTLTSSADGKNYPVSGTVMIYKGSKLKKSLPIQIDQPNAGAVPEGVDSTAVAESPGEVSTTYCTQIDDTFTLKNNEVLKVVVSVEDNYGFRYRQTIYTERFDKDGNSNPLAFSGGVVIE